MVGVVMVDRNAAAVAVAAQEDECRTRCIRNERTLWLPATGCPQLVRCPPGRYAPMQHPGCR